MLAWRIVAMRRKLVGVALFIVLVAAGFYVASPPVQRTPANLAATPTHRDEADASTTTAAPSTTAPLMAALRSKMVKIPGADFMMGANDSDDSQPIHRVHVDAFELDATEVTVHDYQLCVSAGACPALIAFGKKCNVDKPGRDNHPVNCLSATQAETFCRWAGKRLPTEEEWEYAARGTDARKYPWGNELPEQRACWQRSREPIPTCEVGSHPGGVSPFGVHDLAGNVLEWTSSALSSNYNSERSHPERVLRGGCWSDVDPAYLTATGRARWNPDERLNVAGIRCAR